jgi:hypothetical protein
MASLNVTNGTNQYVGQEFVLVYLAIQQILAAGTTTAIQTQASALQTACQTAQSPAQVLSYIGAQVSLQT